MRKPMRLPLAALAIAALPVAVAATDAPHNGYALVDCESCHTLHGALGSGLTKDSTNFALCSGCHNRAGVGASLGFPWYTDDQASPGSGGLHHRWDAPAANDARGASVPQDTEMAKRLDSGKLQCSTCHDQHAANQTFAPSRMRSSIPLGVARPADSGAGLGYLTLTAVPDGSPSKAYLVEIVTAAPDPVTFRLSNDGGASWFGGCTGSTWAIYATGNGCPVGTDVQLNTAGVTVTFTGAAGDFAVGDRWSFYVSYPFLRASNASGEMCEDCHRDRVQSSLAVEGGGSIVPNSGTMFSHPVGEALARTYDRAGAILDANGGVQGTTSGAAAQDGNPTNDLHLDASGRVRCVTCHAPHNADSNSLTTDKR